MTLRPADRGAHSSITLPNVANVIPPGLTPIGAARVLRNLSGSIGTMSDRMAVIAVMWPWRCGGSARECADAPADRRTDAGTTPAARDCADDCSGSGPDQTAADRAIGGIVRVCGGGARQQQSSADYAGDSRLLSHLLNSRFYGANK